MPSIQVPEHWNLRMSDLIADYMMNRFREELACDAERVRALPSRFIPTSAVCEANCIVHGLVAAYKNRVTVNIDARRVAHNLTANEFGKDPDREKKLLEKYDPGPEHLISEPTVVVDEQGCVLTWYLPGVLLRRLQDEMWDVLEHIKPLLKNSTASSAEHKWRTMTSLFWKDASIKGSIELSPAWFQQGRDGRNHVPEVSALLKASNSLSTRARAWLHEMTVPNAILSAALAVMHPDLYAAGWEAMVGLGRLALETGDDEMAEVLRTWSSVYSVSSLMVN
ncbi:hypothetical protein BU15DRAFT_78140 [Melanogaster broomeanus]|nr:hypothetical protein BU15DRAFT_78140 [Melanogaster broomeanus]